MGVVIPPLPQLIFMVYVARADQVRSGYWLQLLMVVLHLSSQHTEQHRKEKQKPVMSAKLAGLKIAHIV